MSFYKEVPGLKTTLESTLKFDPEPKAGSMNPVTSDGIASSITEAVGGASEALQEQIDDIAEKAGSGYIPKGEADVSTLNALTGQENGWLYTMTDAGTLTDGNLAVVAGDTVAWDDANSVWYKAMNYAPAQYGTDQVKNLPTAITAFRTGDVIPVDGPSGTAKMSKDDLLKETAENALGSIHSLSDTATEADLVSGNFLAIDTPDATKKIAGSELAPRSVQDENTRQINHELKVSSEENTTFAYVSISGDFVDNLTNSATGFLEVKKFSSILITGQNTDKVICTCYDENKNFLGRLQYTGDYLENFEMLNVLSNCLNGTKYIVCYGWNSAHDPAPTKDFKVVTKYLGLKNEVNSISRDVEGIGHTRLLEDCGFVDGKSVNNTNGAINDSTNFAASGPIPCENCSAVILSVIITTFSVQQQGLAFYDKDNNFISGVLIYQSQPENGVGEQIIPVPSNAVYFRTTFWNTTNRETYDYKFYCYVVGKFTSDILVNETMIDLNKIYFTDGSAISVNTGRTYPSENMACSNYIDCKDLKVIKISMPFHNIPITAEGLAFYDKNKVVINGVLSAGDRSENGVEIVEIPVPSNAVYFRTTFWNTTNRETYDYKFYCLGVLRQVTLGNAAFKNEDDFAKSHGVLFGSPTPYISEIPTDSVIDDITSSEFYTELDSYATLYADIFHREVDIGVDSDNNGIRHYVLGYNMSYNTSETSVVNTLWQPSQNPKHILLVSGIHGGEKTASVGALKFIEEVLSSSEPWAEYIKTNFIIDYVPIVNVWGFDNFSRENKDGVNVNRDFGTFATSEATAVKNLVESIGNNLIVGIDCHNNRWQGYIMLDRNSIYFDFVSKISYRIIASMRNLLTTLYNDTTKSPYYTLTDNPVVGCLSKWLEQEKGILATTAEAPRNIAMDGSTPNHASMMAITKSILANIIQNFGEFANK